MKILVTGGSGFIGSNLVESLLDKNHEITITGTKTENLTPNNVKFLHLSTSNISKYLSPDVIFHQAANNDTLDYDEEEMMRVNYFDPIDLFNDLLNKGCKKFIYASSTAVYGDSEAPYHVENTKCSPLNIYAKSKLMFDDFAMNFAKENNVSVIGLRYCNIFGKNEFHKGHRASMIYQIYSQIKHKNEVNLFKYGEQKRDYCYVKDVVLANLRALDFEKSGIFNVANGKATSFKELVNIISSKLNTNAKINYIDCKYPEKYQSYIECDITNSIEILKWKPAYSLEDSISEYIDFLEKK